LKSYYPLLGSTLSTIDVFELREEIIHQTLHNHKRIDILFHLSRESLHHYSV
jgi:hypothetical protein